MNFEALRGILNNEITTKTLYFLRKTREGYLSYAPDVSPDIMDQLIKDASRYLQQYDCFEQCDFNPTGCRDSTVEICGFDYVGNFQEVIESLDPGVVEGLEEQVENLSFYCIDLVCENESVRLFRRVTKFKRLYSKGIIATFQGGRLNRLDSKTLGLDGSIDLVAFQGEIAILNHVALERIFRLQEQYTCKAGEAIQIIRGTNKIANFDAFEEDCLNDQRIQKILTRMLGESPDLGNCFDNFDNVVKTIEMFDL